MVRPDLTMKAKTSCVAYEYAVQARRRGRPRKKDASLKLKMKTLFFTQAESFKTATLQLYGEEETVAYFYRDLLLGQGLYQKLRFVFVTMGERQPILVSTDRTLDPKVITRLCTRRFTTETTFRTLKQSLRAFAYHF
nr:hypothetical protein [Sporolactobacillus pectinivorans]